MLNITVKTLDSQNHFFSVPDDLSVRSFKENIASAVGIPPDKQRLIYCGRVLQDDKKLNEYDADGKVIHLVQRPPPATSGRPTTSSFPNPESTAHSQSQNQSQRPEFVHRLGGHDGNSFVLGAFTIPSEAMDSNHVQQIVQQVVSGMGELGRNATVMSRTSDDGSTVDVHINLGQVPLQGDAQNRISLILNMIRRANNCINTLENPNNTTPVNEEAQNEENSRSEQGTPASDTHDPMEDSDTAPRQSTDENVTTETHEAGTPMRPTIISSGFASIADAARMAATAAFAAATSAARATGLATNYSNSSRLASQQTPNEQQHQGGNDTLNSGFRASTPTQHTPQATHPPALVNVLNELQALHSRFQPFLNQYLDCLREDRSYQDNTEEQTRAQALFNCASSVMHYMSHAYHAASDIMIDMSQTPPRSLRCRPVIVQQPAVIQAGVPVQAHINVSTTLNSARSAGQATNSNTSVNTSTNSSVASSTLSSTVSSDNSSAVPPPPPPPVSEQASPNAPIIGAIPNSVASLFSSSNPFVVMELGPSSITIDSISAVTSEGSGSQPVHISGSRFPEVVVQQAPSQDLIQNLMQAVGQTAAQRFGVNGQSQARGNTATHPTTSTQTRSTSRPIQTIPLAIPGFPIATFDPYLPCSSRHVTTFHRPLVPVRTMHPPQSQHQQQTAGSGVGSSNVPLDAQLAGMVANVMSAVFSNSGSTSSAVGTSGSPRTRAQVPSGFPRILVDLMSQWRQAAGEASQYSTIADFLRSLPDFNYQEGEGLLSDMMMCIARHISLREFIEVLFGRTEILSRLRCHLQQFVRTNVLRGKDPTTTNIQAAVTEIVNSIIEELRIVKGDIEVKDGIDYLATMRNFCEQKLLSLINLILSSDNEAEFGSTLYGLCRQIISEYVSLDLHCFKHGQQAVIRIVQNRVRRVASDMDPFTQQWMITWCSSQISGIISNISTEETDILGYVVHSRESSVAPRQGTSMTFETQESASSQSEEAGTSPMEVDIVGSNASENFLIPAATSGNGGSIANGTLAESNVSSMLSSGPAWTSAVPADWVPMITEDIERQRRQSTQRPFSDAYLGMMSSKRRKVMSNGRLQAVVDTANILPDTIRRAVASAGVQPTTSVNELTQDVAGNAALNSVFEQHLCKAICKRLNEDKDYRPEKFPNAENVFNNKHDGGDNV